jgi:hypothetical protein
MSSLITSASTWISNETPKKRVPTMRKTVKKRSNEAEYNNDEPDYGKLKPDTIEELQNISDDRGKRVNDLLNQMSSVEINNEDNLGDFKPITPPIMQSKTDIQSIEHSKDYNPSVSTYLEASTSRKYKANNDNIDYGANDNGNSKLSNYNKSYEVPTTITKPYYANMGITSSNDNGNSSNNDKMMERINYMIHLLEAQQHEKTDNITEEFLLYTFLGVFVIFVVDSFAKTGTYKR